jgi:hypothetical protein
MPNRTLALAALLAFFLPPHQAPAQGSEFPQGAFVVLVQPGDGVSASPGTYLVNFDGHGVFQFRQDTLALVRGAYVSKGDTLEVEDEEGPQACASPSARASYRWTVAANGLILKPLSDSCRGWRTVLAVRPITRRP